MAGNDNEGGKDFEEAVSNWAKRTAERIVVAGVEGAVQLASEAELQLKEGLAVYGGQPRSKDYESSLPGEMPRQHTGDLKNSIGNEVTREGSVVTAKVGSGVSKDTIEYAKYLQGNEEPGIRPFLWYISDFFTRKNLTKYINERMKK